jgi:4-amino-4-deoxy-L-arabinose transferase-like glycosyltransferase
MRSADGDVPRWMVKIVFAVVLLLRIAVMQADFSELAQDPDNYRELAIALRDEHTFGSERDSSGKLMPTAFRPPLYPIVLATVLPRHPMSWPWAIGVLQLMLGTATVWATWRLALEWQLPEKAALLAMCLVGIDPILLQQSSQVMTETLATFLATLALWQLARVERIGARPVTALGAGLVVGLAALCRPTFLLFAVLALIVFAWRELLLSRRGSRLLLFFLGISAMLAPWMVRNYLALGEPIASTTHGGVTLLRGNNLMYYHHLATTPWGTPWNTNEFDRWWFNQCENRRIDTELARDDFAYAQARQAIEAHPRSFVVASTLRFSRLWGVLPWQTSEHESRTLTCVRYGIGVFYIVELCLLAIGVIILGRRLLQPPWRWGLMLAIAFSATHFFYWTDLRMRAPLVPTIALVASFAVTALTSRNRGALANRPADGQKT